MLVKQIKFTVDNQRVIKFIKGKNNVCFYAGAIC